MRASYSIEVSNRRPNLSPFGRTVAVGSGLVREKLLHFEFDVCAPDKWLAKAYDILHYGSAIPDQESRYRMPY